MTGNLEKTTVTVSPQLAWVKLPKYCELSGDTKNAVYAKRKKGIWLDGRQCTVGPDGNLWINLKEVELWVQHGNLPARLKSTRV